MIRAMTECTCPVTFRTTTLTKGRVDVVGPDPKATFCAAAVDALVDRNAQFARSVSKSLLKLSGCILEDGAEGDLVETTLWRPLLLILHSG